MKTFLLLLLFSFNCFAVNVTDLKGKTLTVSGNANITGTETIGTAGSSTTDKLIVNGSVVTPTSTQAGTTFDFYKSGTITCSSCGATSGAVTITLVGLSDGGFYTLDMTDSSTATHTFSLAGLTFVYNPPQAARQAGKVASYNFHRVGTKVLVSLLEF